MDKSNPYKQIEMMVFPQMMADYHKQREALYRAQQYRLMHTLPQQRRTLFRPLLNRLGQWLVSIGTNLQDRETQAARLDIAGQV